MSIAMPTPRPDLAVGIDEPLSILDPDGSRHENATLDGYLDDVDETMLTDLYVDMSIVRRVDQEAFALTRQGELSLWPPLLGQEAAQVGSCHALRSTDFAFGSYREHALPVLRGVDYRDFLGVWKGVSQSGWDPAEYHVATPQIIIGAQTLHATGYAMATRMDGADDLAIAYFGDGATSEGDTSEAMTFASTFRVPVVFFCQNNHYAISEPVRVQSDPPLALRPTGFGIPSLRVDGNDVLAVLAATRIAAERARSGRGPTFIEAVTYRLGPHTTTDDPTRYRDDEEAAVWRERDPIARLEGYLAGLGARSDAIREEAQVRCDAVARDVRSAVAGIETVDSAAMFDHVYTRETARLARQRSEHLAFVGSVGEAP